MALGTVTWESEVNTKIFACGCKIRTNVTPNFLIIYCGQPDCLRLFDANVAYTQQQFNWQHSRGGSPTLVQALLRPMVTPLPQILPPPPAGASYMKGETQMTVQQEEPDITQPGQPGHEPGGQPGQQPGQPGQSPHQPGQPQHEGDPSMPKKPEPHPGDKPPHKPGEKEEPKPRR